MSLFMYLRLALMVFLHYFVWSSWYVTMATYLGKELKFSGEEIGLAYGTTAIGAMVSPFFAGIFADRFFATQRLLATLHLLGAALLYWVSTLTTFAMFYPVLILYTITYMAGHGLTNTLTLHHAVDAKREFPLVMLMGSVGWIAAGWTVSLIGADKSREMFLLAAASALVMGLYSLTLPHTPPRGKGTSLSLRTILGIDAFRLLKDRSFATFLLCSFLICIPLSFYFTWINQFMNEVGIENAPAKLTIGQVSDVVFLLLLPFLLGRLGVKGILLLGMGAWLVRFGLLAGFDAQRESLWMLFTALAVHGMCYDYIFVMGRMYVDNRAGQEIRGAAQGLHAIVTLGLGMFIGSWLAGVVGEHYSSEVTGTKLHSWEEIWYVPAGLSVLLFILFAALFKDRAPAPSTDQAPTRSASAIQQSPIQEGLETVN